MLTLSETRKIESAQDKKYKTRKVAFRLLKKALDEYAYKPYQDAMNKLSNGKALTNDEFITVKNLAANYGKPIPSEKLSLTKNALMNSLRLRNFNNFGQELR